MKTFLKSFIFTWIIIITCCSLSRAYVVSGPTCVTQGVSYTYTFSNDFPSWPSQYTTINGGYLVNLGEHSISVVWSPAPGSPTNLTSWYGGANPFIFNVNVSTPAAANRINLIGYTINDNKVTDLTLSGGDPGGCSMNFMWEDASNGSAFAAVSNGNNRDYILSAGTSNTVTMRRQMWASADPATKYLSPIISIKSYTIQWGQVLGSIYPSPATLCTSGTAVYTWTESTDGVNWTTNNSTFEYNYVNALTATHYYKMVATCGGSEFSTTIFKINVGPQPLPFNPGTITGPSNNPLIGELPGKLVSQQPATGGGCSIYQYQWQQSSDGINFTDIAYATAEAYSPDYLFEATYYRRIVSCQGASQSTNVLVYRPIQPLNGGVVNPGGMYLPADGKATFSSVQPATGGAWNTPYSYQWQISIGGVGSFTDIPGATDVNYQATGLDRMVYFRRKVSCGTETAYSNMAKVINVGSYENENSVRELTAVKPGISILEDVANDLQQVRQSTLYMDGLARPVQNVALKQSLAPGSSSPVDLVTIREYDDMGREVFQYLPFGASVASGNIAADDGLRKKQPMIQLQNFYTDPGGVLKDQQESNFYSKTDYEASPLNRVNKFMSPGINWVGSDRGMETKPLVNTDDDKVVIWGVDNAVNGLGSYRYMGTYNGGTLYKNVTVNEEGKQEILFKNNDGLLILKKVQLTATADAGYGSLYPGWLCTYYIYDLSNQLRAVIQPRGVELLSQNGWDLHVDNDAILNDQCFRYEYDNHQRVVIKKMPGTDEMWMVYNAAGQLVLKQDGNLRDKHQWSYFTYDQLNRPVATGLLTDQANYDKLMYHINEAEDKIEYPDLNSYSTEEHTRNYYDDYKWSNSLVSELKDFSTSYASNYLLPTTAGWPYPQSVVLSERTQGLVTGKRIRVLGTNNYLINVDFYDDKGQLIQVRSQNTSGNIDVITTQYSWTGLPLIKVNKLTGNNNQTNIIVTKSNYDILGRLASTQKKISSSLVNGGSMPANWTTVSDITYDALGRISKKEIGNKPNSSQPLTHQNYEYNISGWLLSINKNYLTGNNNDDYFGMQLGYDKSGVLGTFVPKYNSDISGVLWKSEGDGQKRKYDYTYDNSNRLTSAVFTQYVSGSGHSAVFDLSENIDFSVNNLSYDANGNLMTMQQNGWKFGGSVPIDNLQYSYFGQNIYSNKLSAVAEIPSSGSSTAPLGDFTDNHSGGDDYGYDKNGNLVTDLNKGLNGATGDRLSAGGAITYNHLNLPSLITVKDNNGNLKGTITYTYDATGQKLKKESIDYSKPGKTITTTTTYIDAAIYESRNTSPVNTPDDNYSDVLQSIDHEEGRLRFTPGQINNNAHLSYDYFIKDHLGNIRMVLTDEEDAFPYTVLNFEGTPSSPEVQAQDRDWENKNGQSIGVSGVRVIKEFGSGAPTGNNAMLVRKIDGAIGAGKLLKVMVGDRIHTSVDYFYSTNNANNSPASGISSLIAGFTNALLGSSAITSSLKEAAGDITGSFGSNVALSGILNTPNKTDGNNQAPKAYLNILFFDAQFKFDNSSSIVLPVEYLPNQKGTISKLGADAMEAQKNGYVYVYFSNESNEMVYFDNLMLTHEKGRVLEETHYYPFGLTMAAISSKVLNSSYAENKKKFNGIDQNTDFDLNMYDAFYRNLDPQIGRFWQVDPSAEGFPECSPYESMCNNPVNNIDPLGDFSNRFGAWLHRLWYGGGEIGKNEYGEWYVGKTRTENMEDGNAAIVSYKYYGEGRNQYTAAGENIRDEQEKQADIDHMVNLGVLQRVNSQQEANEGNLKAFAGSLMPNILKLSTAVNVEKVLPGSGPIMKSLGAASKAEMFARKMNMNLNSATNRQVLNNLHLTVQEFISKFRMAKIRAEMPGEFLNMTVEEALLTRVKVVKKLLTDGRFAK